MSLVHWLVVAVLVILLFGGSRFSNMMGDVAKGFKNFKKGMAEEDEPAPAPAARIETAKTIEAERDARPVEADRR